MTSEDIEPVMASMGEQHTERCPTCGEHTFRTASIYAIGQTGSRVIGGYAICEECDWSPYNYQQRYVTGLQENDAVPNTNTSGDVQPNRAIAGLSVAAVLAAPGLCGVWIWTGDGRYGWLALPALAVALVLFLLAFALGGSRR